MRKRARECTVAELVAEKGRMGAREIFPVIRQLCLLSGGREILVHPRNVRIGGDGRVCLLSQEVPLPDQKAYLPPELDREETDAPGARVYALGMLMLYMAAGTLKKTEAQTILGDGALLRLIKRCVAFDPEERFATEEDLLKAIRGETSFCKSARPVFLGGAVLCLLTACLLFFWREGGSGGKAQGESYGQEAGFAEGFAQGFSDAPGIGLAPAFPDRHAGNLSGNYAAWGGSFTAFSEHQVFFALDKHIWKMDAYTGETQIAADVKASALQFYHDRLYFCARGKLFSLDPETGKMEVLSSAHSGQLYIFEDTFYLYDDDGTGYLYRIDPDTGHATQLNGAMEYRCLNVVEGRLYYIDPNRGNSICRSNLDGGSVSLISSGAYESFCIYDGYIYADAAQGLIRMDLSGGSLKKMTVRPVHCPIAAEKGIFYLSGTGRTVEWMSLDGKTRYTVVTTQTDSFTVAGQWIFYRNAEDESKLWRVRISGKDSGRISVSMKY